jgi:hypothetical protein
MTSLWKLNYAGNNGVTDRRENRGLIQSAIEENLGTGQLHDEGRVGG